MEATNKTKALLGGEWIIKESNPHETFIPEEFNEEQTMVMDMCHQFLEAEILPIVDRIDKMEPGLVASLMQKAGEQGLLSTSFPEEYGGLGKDFITSTIVNEGMGGGYSFSVAVAAHTGIGSLPILYFGTEEQKQKYIPKLASGEWKGAYGLTEPNSGSDALGAKTTAKLSDDGKHYLLNGQKCWITNGGFADVFTVFAKIDGDKFTGFIIERGTEGFTQGPEEHKMGIKGSSTVQLYFQDCKVPVENVLGEIGKGHIIAFNILNIGRLKLCAATLGGAKKATDTSVQYAKTREQFKLPIAKFGAIRHKMAEMAIRLWVCESALYRSAKWIDDKEHELAASGKSFAEALLGAAEEYAIECAMLKVYGSEVLDFVVDEGVQIHGGNGFSDEYVISKAYRDSRINRIYEGTNEINRLLTVDMVLKRAMKGKLDLMGPAMSVQKELMSIPDFGSEEEGTYAKELKAIANFKKAILMVAGAAVQKLMMQLDKEQEILMNIADMAIEVFHAESALLRVMKLASLRGDAAVATQNDIMRTYLYDAADRINKAGKDALNSFADGDELRMMHIGLKRFTKVEPFNSKEARRRISDRLVADNGYKI
ncbi:MAG TPA: acyl-CoA dehydrogenase family protein [Sediminibacterium sp.]|jgi:alkylation response protein AidB-like acyl-CoA dehydrogenase|uniref:acyl-CoA dehydrogenase family protein n=1 Tax=Sediminibacterium sp. TaxID=1917865 RepID=UPI0008D62CB7|nr:acyl-CoA dehydrogenase family protein [Sediminibacterium sp.]OHC86660.1 MAG: acyl-CoA dehydrogenase [Sphingobacteriia bacterium RIFOXYC2_FULL_35_18]OHC88483.1 MAG: acyl-CoA dehydrogenase [Sphingobacteriia bacterium RIFOXYD2_FULL_35_12]OYY11524.1 MAG: acyl-CoA dehydrogenase [Sphingobacteriia bacterium 35-36-14]OYZ54363.1 MAG: acyl-CoA dehydrogenase [Sphingobacteriia bacterium 24-36-13]OZA63522.1 MAG: acyl-CoA dehydrogenase [Sphingobacteriia bacterium 39-36-14]